jgi:hypothetical protein
MDLTFRLLVSALAAAAVTSCASTSSTPREEAPSAVAAPSQAPSPSSTPSEASPVARTEIPDAIVELQEKIQPSLEGKPPAPPARPSPPEAPDPEKTKVEVEAALVSFLDAIAQGETEKARGSLISRAEFERYVTAGFEARGGPPGQEDCPALGALVRWPNARARRLRQTAPRLLWHALRRGERSRARGETRSDGRHRRGLAYLPDQHPVNGSVRKIKKASQRS